MKKALVVFMALAFAASIAYAQGARNPAYLTEGKTNVTSIGVQGLNTAGNPGYIELYSVTNQGAQSNPATSSDDPLNTWYLWIDTTGDLCMASYTTISAFASFPTGDWTTGMGAACTKVGGQS